MWLTPRASSSNRLSVLMADIAKPSPPELKNLKPALPDVWDLAKLEASVNATSQRAVTQWLAYLSLWAYLFFTTLSITHRDLILLTPVKLPLIGVELGLREYFWAGPPLFWVFHLYLVRKITVLARDVAFYRAVMKRIVSSAAAREPLYRRLDAFFLTRLLGYREQGRLLRWLDGGIAVATVVVMPLALMVAFQLYYLAYHDPDATDWHRGWLVADVLLLAIPLLWRLWGRSREANGLVNGKRRRLRGWVVVIGKTLGLTLAFGGCVAFSLAIATFPDDRMDWALSAVGLSGKNHPLSSLRVLAPRDTDFVNDEKLDKVQWTVDLRGRDLRGANLSGADLRKARMAGVNLRGANLRWAELKEADLSDSVLDYSDIEHCQCQGVKMKNAKLRGSRLNYSYFNGANLSESIMSGAYISRSHFQFANIDDSHLEGVVSRYSEFQGSSIENTNFSGSDLTGSSFEGVSLNRSSFVGSDMTYVRLWGAEMPHISVDDRSMMYLMKKRVFEREIYAEDTKFNDYFDLVKGINLINFSKNEKNTKENIVKWFGLARLFVDDERMIYRSLNLLSELNDKNDKKLREKINTYITGLNFSQNMRTNFLVKLVCEDYPQSIHGIISRIYYELQEYTPKYSDDRNISLVNDSPSMDVVLMSKK